MASIDPFAKRHGRIIAELRFPKAKKVFRPALFHPRLGNSWQKCWLFATLSSKSLPSKPLSFELLSVSWTTSRLIVALTWWPWLGGP